MTWKEDSSDGQRQLRMSNFEYDLYKNGVL